MSCGPDSLHGAGSYYDYSDNHCLSISDKTYVCEMWTVQSTEIHCRSVRCNNDNIVLPPLTSPPEPLSPEPTTEILLRQLMQYNACFQVTSFGATGKCNNPYMKAFKCAINKLTGPERKDRQRSLLEQMNVYSVDQQQKRSAS